LAPSLLFYVEVSAHRWRRRRCTVPGACHVFGVRSTGTLVRARRYLQASRNMETHDPWPGGCVVASERRFSAVLAVPRTARRVAPPQVCRRCSGHAASCSRCFSGAPAPPRLHSGAQAMPGRRCGRLLLWGARRSIVGAHAASWGPTDRASVSCVARCAPCL